MYIHYNPNPNKALVGDCTIRAIAKAINKEWDDTYLYLAMQGFKMKDMPSSNRVWGEFLQLIKGRSEAEIWLLMDELMQTILITNPRLYDSVLRKIKEQF